MTTNRTVRLTCSHGPDIAFTGHMVDEYSTQNKAGTKPRWTELRLWMTEGGTWIAENVGMSAREGEGEIRQARAIETSMTLVEMQRTAMDLWEWTTAAKAFARQMGWDMTLRVD